MPKYDRDIKDITECARKTLLRMAEFKVPLTPENYLVWFEYFTGSIPALRIDVDELIAAGGHFTEEENRRLYERHFTIADTKDLAQQVNRETQKILKNIFDQFIAANKSTSDYSEKLDKFSDEINKATDLSDVQGIIVDMIRDTNEMAASSRRMQEELRSATARAESLQRKLEETEREATTDALTGLNNRKAYDRKIEELYQEYQAKGSIFSMLMIDIDFFKKFNDKYGHRIGDEVLRQVGDVLRKSMRRVDFPARYGGEEMVALLPMTPLNNAYIIAELIRKRVTETKLKVIRTGENLDQVTVSIGVAVINPNDTAASLSERADKALYFAKHAGRNTVKQETDLACQEELSLSH